MCGIAAILDVDPPSAPALRERALRMARLLRHRGPDWSGVYADDGAVLAHERLAIVDVDHGAQPLVDPRTGVVLAANGEIYDHRELRASLRREHTFLTDSDCEVLLALWDEEAPASFLPRINGIFAFVAWNPRTRDWLVARDPIGVVPLYVGWDDAGRVHVASELKALVPWCGRIEVFPPGHYWLGSERDAGFRRWYRPAWIEPGAALPTAPSSAPVLREALVAAVRRQLMCDVPYGLLISGGVDSSLVAAIAARFADRRVEDGGSSPSWWPRLHSFSVGLPDSPDLRAARRVAEAIGSVHHEVIFSVQEGLDALSDVIWHLETFDVTSIRAATPMFLMARRIRATGIKMILSGEGADEVFGGYLYFHKAPSPRELFDETVRKLGRLHLYDCNRANKAMAAWGIEARVPFLDREFLEVAMALDPAAKMPRPPGGAPRIEKHVLREAFEGWIPEEVLWRQKEQFSDGVGYGWIGALRARAEALITDGELADAGARFPDKTPATKEAYWYRLMFERHFGAGAAVGTVPHEASVACSTPTALAWDAAFQRLVDPSGRAVVDVHHEGLRRAG